MSLYHPLQTSQRAEHQLLAQFFPAASSASARPGFPPLRTVFVDRDGVINVNRPDHVRSWSDFTFIPAALDGLALLHRHGWRVVVLTNQAVVNRGQLAAEDLFALHERMAHTIAAYGGEVAAVLACPHRPDEGCDCRKPRPGLLITALRYFKLNPAVSYFVGDHESDLQAATRAGCRSILVLSGRGEARPRAELPASCAAILDDLAAAARFLTNRHDGHTPFAPFHLMTKGHDGGSEC